jgi:putative IMPACT (imprinted ancient) family translation regulator
MWYMYPAIAVFILVACYFCTEYNDKQVDSRLAKEGVTVYCRIDSVYEWTNSKRTEYHVMVDYNRSGKNQRLDLEVDYKDFVSSKYSDTLILKRLPNNDAPSYMKVSGFRGYR